MLEKSNRLILIQYALLLFLLPLFFINDYSNTFTQSKELLLKIITTTLLISILFIPNKIEVPRLKKPLESTLTVLVFGFFILQVISTFLSPTPIPGIYGTWNRGGGLLTELYLITFFILSILLITKEKAIITLKYAFFGGVLSGLLGIFQSLNIDPLFSEYQQNIFDGRIFSTLGNPGWLGQYMTLTIIIGIFFAIKTTSKFKVLYFLVSIIPLYALFLSETRAAMLSLILCGFLITLKYRSKIYKTLRKYSLPTIIILSLLVSAVSIQIKVNDRFNFSEIGMRSMLSRLEIWQGTLNLIQEKPLTGHGAETFYIKAPEIISPEFIALEENANLSIDKVHNEFLETTFATGILGGLAYLSIFILIVLILFKSKEPLLITLSLITIANILQNQLSFPDISAKTLYFFSLASLIALSTKSSLTIKAALLKISIILLLIVTCVINFHTVYKRHFAEINHSNAQQNLYKSPEKIYNFYLSTLKTAPYYSNIWYEFMMLFPDEREAALKKIEIIEKESGTLLAWKGNNFKDSNPHKATSYYLRALEKNPYHPQWIKAFADMLAKNGDHENANFLYKEYLKIMPTYRNDNSQKAQNLHKTTPEIKEIEDKLRNF